MNKSWARREKRTVIGRHYDAIFARYWALRAELEDRAARLWLAY